MSDRGGPVLSPSIVESSFLNQAAASHVAIEAMADEVPVSRDLMPMECAQHDRKSRASSELLPPLQEPPTRS